MYLTDEEKNILAGGQGEVMAKIMKTLVMYGDTFHADRFVDVTGPGGHLVTSFGVSIMTAMFDVMDEIIDAGIKSKTPFTVDPRPIDNKNVPSSLIQMIVARVMYGKQKNYEEQLRKLGLKNDQSFTCTCYMEEVGNIPARGDVLSWAESSAVVYANSVLGARCNRNSAFIDIFGAITGRVPNFGLLLDEERRASWVIEVRTTHTPEAQILGSAIGLKVLEKVPYIKGLSEFLGHELTDDAKAYLKDMGAASASNGAVGLFHVEELTPEAKDLNDALICENHQVYVIDDAEMERVRSSYPVMWQNPDAAPKLCFIGCPHLSVDQLISWTERLEKSLAAANRNKICVKTVFTAAPDVLSAFAQTPFDARLRATGARLSYICPLMYMNNPKSKNLPVITNSNKLRTYTNSRYYTDDEICSLIIKGAAL
ncbi:MAG: aconitase X [Eubacteriales bacterium]